MTFLPYPVIDLYIRTFVSGYQPHSGHRRFIDPRPNAPGHLWLGFTLSRTRARDSSRRRQPTSACCVSPESCAPGSSNAVSEGAFQGVTPSFHSSEYQLGNSLFSCRFYLLTGFSRLEFIRGNVSLHCQRAPFLRRNSRGCFSRFCLPPFYTSGIVAQQNAQDCVLSACQTSNPQRSYKSHLPLELRKR